MAEPITIDQWQFIEVPETDTAQDEIRRLQSEIDQLRREIVSAKSKPQLRAPAPPCMASRQAYEAIKAQNLATPYGAMIQGFIDNGVPAPPWEW